VFPQEYFYKNNAQPVPTQRDLGSARKNGTQSESENVSFILSAVKWHG
jgi:hypothetical protein